MQSRQIRRSEVMVNVKK